MLYSSALTCFALFAASTQALALPAAAKAAAASKITITGGAAPVAAKADGCQTSKAMHSGFLFPELMQNSYSHWRWSPNCLR